MEDKKEDLDDFFAKRDKKKKSGKKKYETTEELAKILGKRTEERKKLEEGKSQYVVGEGSTAPPAQNEDDEWLEQKDDKVDLSGLKVAELVLGDEEEVEVVEGKDPEIAGTTDGPWRKRAQATTTNTLPISSIPGEPEQSSEEGRPNTSNKEEESSLNSEDESVTPTPEEEKAPPVVVTPAPTPAAPPTTGKYVSPAVRKAMELAALGGPLGGGNVMPPTDIFANRPLSEGGGGSGGDGVKGAYVPPGRRAGATGTGTTSGKPRKTVAAPNIHDEEYFPSLGAS